MAWMWKYGSEFKNRQENPKGQAHCHPLDGLQEKHLFTLPDDLAHPICCEVQINVQENSTTAKF